MLAQAIIGFTEGNNKFTGTYYNCGKTGHTKRECLKKSKKALNHKISLFPRVLNNLRFALDVKKEIIGHQNVNQHSKRMEPSFRETRDRASPRPRQQSGQIWARQCLKIISLCLLPKIISTTINSCHRGKCCSTYLHNSRYSTASRGNPPSCAHRNIWIHPSKYSWTYPWSFKLNIKGSYSPH